ncbi:MAG TPA: primosomal protein N' [Candidatus Kapabacteria bacterium]|nr:primosomal protein N' [Candidatus Kapabacteria bacterium]
MSLPRYVTVAIPLNFKFHSGGFEGLTYSIPKEFTELARAGVRAVVPLGKRQVTGVIVGFADVAPANVAKIRPIADILDKELVFDEAFLAWTKWIAGYYLSSWGEVLEAALPQGLRTETKSKVTPVSNNLSHEIAELSHHSKRRAEVLKLVASYPNGVFISHLTKHSKITGLYAHLHALEAEGYVHITSVERSAVKVKRERVVLLSNGLVNDTGALSAALMELEHSPKQARVLLKLLEQKQLAPDEPLSVKLLEKELATTASVINALAKKSYIRFEEREIKYELKHTLVPTNGEANDVITLNSEQQIAEDAIISALDAKKSQTFLIHGITGSGKTEVYITLARKVIEEGGGVLVLVPEISLTPQLIDRFKRRLNMNISVLHSRMSISERFASWQALARGETKISIGARSAVFAPVRDLRLIIVDEEHEVTYKQYDSMPRYHARDAAVMRAHLNNAVTVLGSATPSLESYYNAEQKKYTLLKLTRRAQEAKLPPVKVVDMRRPLQRAEQSAKAGNLSDELKAAIAVRLSKKQGIVLLQNRRGFSTYLACSNCGEAIMCPNCAVTLTWHRDTNRMQCHYCGFMQKKSEVCPTCGSEKMYLGGVGTERVEEELLAHFPEIKIARMDLDTTARRGSFEQILRSFASGEADVLLGTQMVAKGLDFSRVTLVGVINADTSLCLPDFRSSERTFQLLTQVSGRAGRTEELAGEVLVQSFQPQHPAIGFASKHDYEGFYKREIGERRESLYPPYVRLILVEFLGATAPSVAEKARAFATLIPPKATYYQLLGPAEPAIKKLRGEFRHHLIIKNIRAYDPGGEKMRRLLAGALEQYQDRYASRNITVTVDVDVQGVL